LKKYPNKINWINLSDNPNDEAIELLKYNLDKIAWWKLSRNGLAIDWDYLSSNPSIFKLDYEQLAIRSLHASEQMKKKL
jgi:hypothetical protein